MEEQYYNLCNTLIFNESVHAMITVTDEGKITIEGMKGSCFMGIDRKKAGAPAYDDRGRLVPPNVSFAHIKLD